MTSLPPGSDFTASTVTEGQFKTAITNLRSYLAGLLGVDGTRGTALLALGALASQHMSKSGAYTVTTGDRGAVIDASGSWTLSLPAVNSAGDGFSFMLRNAGTGTITIDPSASETIDGAATLAFGPGRSAAVVCTGTAWITVEPRRQADAADTTAGMLMAVGAFGLGNTGAADLAPGNDIDALTATGFWRLSGGTTGAPSGRAGMVLHMTRQSLSTVAPFSQLAIDSLGEVYTRVATGISPTTWGAWRRVYDQGAILGTVSETSGTPTGAIIERGSNANGEYARYADGTQICTVDDLEATDIATGAGSNYTSLTVSWTFPAAFVAAPAVSPGGNTSVNYWTSTIADSGTAASARLKNHGSVGTAVTFGLVAVGRWF